MMEYNHTTITTLIERDHANKYHGFPTMFFWLDTAAYLKQVEWIFERDGLNWIDHSDGLLSAFSLRCTAVTENHL
jgi:hypothetical protein